MTSIPVVTIPWQTVADLQWGPSRAATSEASYIAEMRSKLIADLILIRRWGARGDLDAETRWLYRHPDTHDFLIWLDDYYGALPASEQDSIGVLLDEYLAHLWGE